MAALSEKTRELVEELYKKPSLLSFRRADRERHLLDAIGASRERSALIYVLPFLLDNEVRSNAFGALASLMERMPIREFWDFAEFRGGHWGAQYTRMSEWFQLVPTQVAQLDHAHAGSVFALGAASAHGNGHVREEAIRLLAKRREPTALYFIIPHVNEWVPQIRLRAKTVMLAKLKESPGEFAIALPLIERLQQSRRDDHAGLVDAIHRALIQEPGLPSLRAATETSDRVGRRMAYQLALSSADVCVDNMIGPALACDDMRVRMTAARLVMKKATLVSWIDALCTNRVPSVRRLVLEGSIVSSNSAVLKAFLLDPNAGVRSAAQFYLRQEGTADIATIYRDTLSSDRDARIATALLGLAEVKSISDLSLVIAFLRAPKPLIRAAAVTAIGNMGREDAAPLLTAALGDPSARVSNAAVAALRKRGITPASRELLGIFDASTTLHVRRNAAKLMSTLPRWTALACLLHCALDTTSAGSLAIRLIDAWLGRANLSFVTPTADELGDIERKLSLATQVIGERAPAIDALLDIWAKTKRPLSR